MKLAALDTPTPETSEEIVQPVYLRIKQIEQRYSTSRWTIYRMANRGELKIYKLSSTSLIKVRDIEKLLEESAARQTASVG